MALERATNRFLKLRKSDLLVVYTRVNGVNAHFDERDAIMIITQIEDFKKTTKLADKLTLMLHSQGGDLVPAIKVATLLQGYYKEIETVVLNLAKSSLALLALTGSACYMDEGAALSDFSINENEAIPAKTLKAIHVAICTNLGKGILKEEDEDTALRATIALLLSKNEHGTNIGFQELKAMLPNRIKPLADFGIEKYHLSVIHDSLTETFDNKEGICKIVGFNGKYTVS